MTAPAAALDVAPTTRPAGPPAPYLLGPALDLTFIAGGLTFVLLPLCAFVPPEWGPLAFFGLNFLCNYPHYMATLHRIYRSRSQIERYKVFSIHLTALVVLTAVVSTALGGAWLPFLFTLYFNWSPYHYTGQNYGIAVMYLRRGGVALDRTDRWLLYLPCLAAFLMHETYLNLRTTSITHLPFVPLGIPEAVGRPAYLVLLAVGVASAAVFARRLAGRAPARVATPAILLLATQFTWFSVASGLLFFARELSLGWVRFETIAPAIAFLHCAQYLGVTAYYAEREQAGQFRFARYIGTVIVGGIFLWVGTVRLLSETLDVDYGLTSLVMLSLINIHHFFMDGAIWKLRDGRLARLLIAPAAEVSPAPVALSRRRSGSSTLAWAAAVVVALGLAGTDFMNRALLLRGSALAAQGRWPQAEATYETVLGLNRRSAAALGGLAEADARTGDFADALAHYEAALRLNPRSASAHAGLGRLYLSAGRADDAVTHLERADALMPRVPSTLQYLAMAYQRKGDRAGAQATSARLAALEGAARPSLVY